LTPGDQNSTLNIESIIESRVQSMVQPRVQSTVQSRVQVFYCPSNMPTLPPSSMVIHPYSHAHNHIATHVHTRTPTYMYHTYTDQLKFQNKGEGMKQTFEKPSHKKWKLARTLLFDACALSVYSLNATAIIISWSTNINDKYNVIGKCRDSRYIIVAPEYILYGSSNSLHKALPSNILRYTKYSDCGTDAVTPIHPPTLFQLIQAVVVK